jgi:hypothetical protein
LFDFEKKAESSNKKTANIKNGNLFWKGHQHSHEFDDSSFLKRKL